jgi:hypothetical protein
LIPDDGIAAAAGIAVGATKEKADAAIGCRVNMHIQEQTKSKRGISLPNETIVLLYLI